MTVRWLVAIAVNFGGASVTARVSWHDAFGDAGAGVGVAVVKEQGHASRS